jgi:putative glutamine transport system substrate-binding protein
MNRKFLTTVLASVLAMGVLTACSGSKSTGITSNDPAIQKIQKEGVLKVGAKVDVPKFGYKDPKTDKVDGFEIDIARAIAKKILGDESKIEVTGVNAKTRGPALDNGELDVVIATFTITDERKKSWNFSQPYYQDAIGFLVNKDSGIKSWKDLNGKTIGVAQSATTKAALQKQADADGAKVNFAEFPGYPELKAALAAKRIDAFSVDRAILFGYVDDKTTLLADKISPQVYGVATKLDNKELAKQIDDLIGEMKKNGELDKLIKKWGLN